MLFEFWLLLAALTLILFFAGFFGVPKQDRNTRTTLMVIVCVLSFLMAMSSFSIDVNTCANAANNTCEETITYNYQCVQCNQLTDFRDIVNETHSTTCTDAGLTCITQNYNETVLVGFFFLLAALSLIYVLMEMLGYLPTEQVRSGLYGGEKQAPQEFGKA